MIWPYVMIASLVFNIVLMLLLEHGVMFRAARMRENVVLRVLDCATYAQYRWNTVCAPLTALHVHARTRGMLTKYEAYGTLRELERRGMVMSWESASESSSPARGGRPRRYYTITDCGHWHVVQTDVDLSPRDIAR